MATRPVRTQKPGAFSKTWRVLSHLVEHGDSRSAHDIAVRLHMPLPTVLRMLGQLKREGLVQFDDTPKLYCVGPVFYRMVALVGGPVGLLTRLVEPLLASLAKRTGETACLNLLQPEDRFSVVSVADGAQSLRYVIEIGGLHPLDRGAGGKAILAFRPVDVQRAIVALAPDPPELGTQLSNIARDGFALTFAERVPGAVGLAVPVRGRDGLARGSVQLTVPEHRFSRDDLEHLLEPLRHAADSLADAYAGEIPKT